MLCAQDSPAFTVVGHGSGRHAEHVGQLLLGDAVVGDQLFQVGGDDLGEVLGGCGGGSSGGDPCGCGGGSSC